MCAVGLSHDGSRDVLPLRLICASGHSFVSCSCCRWLKCVLIHRNMVVKLKMKRLRMRTYSTTSGTRSWTYSRYREAVFYCNMIWKTGSCAGLHYLVTSHWTSSSLSQLEEYDVKKAIHQRKFVVSKAYQFNEGMYRMVGMHWDTIEFSTHMKPVKAYEFIEGRYGVKSHDGTVGLHWVKLEDCTHMKCTTAWNCGKHIRGNTDDCTCMKYDVSSPGTMF